jgi:uncharacterized repeat protein (TIGR01451 family)
LALTVLFLSAVGTWARPLDVSSGAGATITNRAEATYQDAAGESFSTVSETVTVTVVAVATLVVTPDDTTPSDSVSPHDQATRAFRVCNTGNNADTFTVTRIDLTAPATLDSAYFDNDGNGAISSGDTQITVNQTPSPQLQPGKCVPVLVSVKTNDAAPHSTITLGLIARSNALNAVNGQGQDSGTIINSVGEGPRLTDPDNPNQPPSSLINGKTQVVLSIGSTFTSSLAFTNSGDAPARNVVITQSLPDGIEFVPDSLQVDTTTSTAKNNNSVAPADAGRNIAIHLPSVAPAEIVRLSFRLKITGGFAGGSAIITGPIITADNVAAVNTLTARVVIDPFGVVFAGRAGSSAPVTGAQMELLSSPDSETGITLPPGSGFAPNDKNENPFVSDGQGHYSFGFPSTSGAGTFFLKVRAQGYITRMIQLGLQSTQSGAFTLTAHALDSQPLASAAGFDLVREDVHIENLAALAMNLPLFESAGLEITKSADRAQAEIGDVVNYRIEVHNPTSASVGNVVVNDRLPASFHYADGSALINLNATIDSAIQPQSTNGDLQFRIAEIPHGATAHLSYRVRVGTNAVEGDQTNVAVASGMFPSGEKTTSGAATAVVHVSAGVFSTRQIIVGRVFVDNNGNGQFDDGDRPMPGIRLFLSNGQSVITDSAGMYNFPSLGDGSQVISLDPISVPAGYALTDGDRESGKGWTRLLRTPVGGGAMLRQNFALKKSAATSSSVPSAATQSTPAAANAAAQPNRAEPVAGSTSSPSGSAAKAPTAQPQTPGTYEIAATDNVEHFAPGQIKILSPTPNSVSMAPGAQVEVRTAVDWTVRLELNGALVSDKNIGVRSIDHKNQVATFTFVGINLEPGPNKLRCTAVGPNEAPGKSDEIVVMGRGPAKQLQIVSEKSEIQSGGSDSTIVRVKAFDQWNNPALDSQIGIKTSVGRLAHPDGDATTTPDASAAGKQPDAADAQMLLQTENGEAVLKLIGAGAPGEARLHAQTGDLQADDSVRITSEMRPTILVGFADMSFGKGIPEVALRNETGNFRSRLSFFYSGKLPWNSMLTLSYDTQRPINRTAGRDRLFQLDPLDRAYPLFGDSSTRFEAAASNSKVYARIDHKRSFAMFGDFETDMDGGLATYTRKLTGVKTHIENSNGDFITITGARPDTSFARDVFAAGTLSLIQLSNLDILPGSETVVLELRDRRNPEVILSSETLTRSIDYNLDPLTGRLFLLRYVSTFDQVLNLTQIVVTYEHRATSMSSAVYTGRARKNFTGIGLKLGVSAAMQRDASGPDFFLGGVDLDKTLPGHGSLQFAWATSQGEVLGSGNIATSSNERHDGDAYQLTIAQPLPFFNSTLRAHYLSASEHFFNPFGGTVTPGSRRGEVAVEMKPGKHTVLKFGGTSERNQTVNVNNGRLTLSAALEQTISERVKLHFGFDHRAFTDNLNDNSIDSNLVTVGAEVKATDKLQFSVKREQNLGDADPTYPTQTTLGATYQLSALTKLFFTQRLAAAPIVPIGDFAGNGFAGSGSRRETAFGVETRFGKYTSMTSRYQLENAINGTDSFAVIGLQNRLPLTKELSAEVGFERGFHLLGPNKSFDSATLGFGWQPNADFRASARYEYRDRGGVGQLVAVGAAGRLAEGITALSRIQWSRGSAAGRTNSLMEGTAALAFRPVESDRAGLLFSYTHHSQDQEATGVDPTRDRRDTISSDGYFQATDRLELYGRMAMNFNDSAQPNLPDVSTLTYLAQARAQYLVTKRVDWAFETRLLFQPSSASQRNVYGSEVGFWILPDLRLGGGYNFTGVQEPAGSSPLAGRRGFYFTVTSKLSNLFDLFGTSKSGLASATDNESPDKQK